MVTKLRRLIQALILQSTVLIGVPLRHISSLRSWRGCRPPPPLPRHWLDWFEVIIHVFLYWFHHVKVNYCSCCRRINHHNLWLAAADIDILRVSLRKFLLKRPAIHPLASLNLIFFAVNIFSNQNINVSFFIINLFFHCVILQQRWNNSGEILPLKNLLP